MASNGKSVEFTAAIQGYNLVYVNFSMHSRKRAWIWCFQCKDCLFADYTTVSHLPREISQPTKYLLDRGATITCSYYHRSPLFQGDLEIPCSVTVSMPGTIWNHLLLDRYGELVTELYRETKDEVIIGNFLSPTKQLPIERPQEWHRKFSVLEKEKARSKDIRLLFRHQEEKNRN